jgi:solute:Na+ symporter, SSS family
VRVLAPLDWIVIVGYLVVVFAIGLALTRRAGQDVENFFVGGRALPWWLAGVSMAATNFSIDTPITIAGFVASEGIGGVWFFWSMAISALLVTFLFARLWRRAGVITDAEIIERRYSGRSAAALRLFKGFYFGVIFNAFIMGWVFLALAKVVGGIVDVNVDLVLVVATVLVFVYTLASGFYGVVLTDFFQYFIAVVGAILLAWFAVAEVGGLAELVATIEASPDAGPATLRFLPGLGEDAITPISVLAVYLLVQWWAHKYADGGGKHIQRMLSTKDENHSVAASLFFAFANYALQVWPWILTGLAAVALFGRLEDPEMGYSMVMAEVLPAGLLGLVLVCLVGAFMSTIDTHLNLGASYIVNDIYRRFWVKDASDRHYVMASRVAMGLLLAIAVLLSRSLESVGGTWKFLLTFASGAGLTWIVRWFWWRANAWTEIAGMLASGVVASYLQLRHPELLYSWKLLITVGISTPIWLVVTFATPPDEEEVLARFVRDIRPGSPGWSRICRKLGIEQEAFLLRALGWWALGLVALFCLNFGLGSLLLMRPEQGVVLMAVGLITLVVLLLGMRRENAARPATGAEPPGMP